MKIEEITYMQFEEFAKNHPLSNYCQNSKYALVMSDYGYSYDYVALINKEKEILAASLILTKRIKGKAKYGYAPKGFLVNYYDPDLLKEFLKQLRSYYKKRDFIFIKFNPEIIIGETDRQRSYVMSYNGNVRLIDDLKALNVKRRLELREFDLMMPKFTSYIDLKNFDLSKLKRNFRKKIKSAGSKGMIMTLGGAKEVEVLYNIMKDKAVNSLSYYRNLYNIYSKDNSIDLVFLKVDFESYLMKVREKYDKEIIVNDRWNDLIQTDPKKKHLNRKINSDRKLQALKDEIIKATEGLKAHREAIIAGALVIKSNNRIIIAASGYDTKYKALYPNHFLHYAIIERYKDYFQYCDFNGISGNFEKESKYFGLNQFKLGFEPTVYEFVGEFDLICSDRMFKKLIKTSFIEDEFSKERK